MVRHLVARRQKLEKFLLISIVTDLLNSGQNNIHLGSRGCRVSVETESKVQTLFMSTWPCFACGWNLCPYSLKRFFTTFQLAQNCCVHLQQVGKSLNSNKSRTMFLEYTDRRCNLFRRPFLCNILLTAASEYQMKSFDI